MIREVDEISEADLIAAADFYDSLVSTTSPQLRAEMFAKNEYGVELTGYQLNRIMGRFATGGAKLENIVTGVLRKCEVIK